MGKKDPNAPKRPLSAYFTWLGENRAQVKQDNPSMPHKEVTSKLGQMWNALDEAVKNEYKSNAQKKMAIWKREFEEYKKTDEYAAEFQAQKQESSATKKKGKKKKPPKDPHAPKRPSTGFFIFVSEKRQEVKDSLPPEEQKKVTIITKKCGEMWKACSPEEQAKYKDRSNKAKEKWKEDMAAYKETQHYRDYQKILKEFKESQKASPKKSKRAARVIRPVASASDTSEGSSDEST